MILHQVELHNFGIYAGDNTFNLKPQADEQYQRPIILFRGQNGVGKTTLMEAIRFCLHGKLSLGSRVTQREYDYYLQRRLHRNEAGETAVSAAVQLEFEHTFLGRRQQYRVRRAWTDRLATELTIWIDNELFAGSGPSGSGGGAAEEEKEHLLRELVPAGVADLFFFDGEKIATLSEASDAGDALLAESVKNLLGLHLVERLDRDLDVYLTRQTGIQEMHQHQAELTQINEEQERLLTEQKKIQDQLRHCRQTLRQTQAEITLLEERISSEGGRYAAQQANYKAEREKLEAALAEVEQEIYELSRGVLPFAVAPKLLRAVQQRLDQEADFEEWRAAQKVVEKIKRRLGEAKIEYTVSPDPPTESEEGIVQQVLAEYDQPPVPETAVIHRVSPETKEVMSGWIEDALTTVPQQLVATMHRRDALKEQLATVKESLSRVPVIDLIRPLQEELQQRNREYGRLEVQEENFSGEEKRLAFHLERLAGSKRRVREQIANIETNEDRIKLAARVQQLLDDYYQKLVARKLAQLEQQMVKRLNQLSRKRNFIERVEIDPHTFTVTLYRAGRPFPRTQLSAGEDQIFAIATLWALREVSGRPLPVIIDTPLSRLDDVHRQTILGEFMTQVSQQVIVLATTVEVDEETLAFMQPALSRVYLLEADSTTNQTSEMPVQQTSLIQIEEVQVAAN